MMTTKQSQATRIMSKHSSQLPSDSIDGHQSRTTPTESQFAREDFHEILLQLDSNDEALKDFCGRHVVATCNVIQTAWAIVVSCYAGVEDVSFVYSINDGQIPDLKAERSCLYHAQINSESRLLDTILVAKKNVNNELNHSDYPDAECLDASLCEVTSTFSSGLHVNYQPRQHVDQTKQEVMLSRCHVLVQIVIKDDDLLSVSIRAHASKFSATGVRNVAHTLEKTLSEITKAHPQSLIKDLNICSQRDLEKIMSWNQTVPVPVESCFHWHFETVVRRAPDATAICSWDRSFTYNELDTASTKLANHLRHLGVMPEVFVGICFNKASVAYVCMLSIMKAGGAFVAIDPSYPPSRIQAIVESTKALVFMAEPTLCPLFNDFTKHVMAIDAKIIDELPLRSSLPGPQSNPSNVAYAVFTSGSTGSPKGIMIEHRSLCSTAFALAAPMRIDSSSRVLQFAAYTFDVSYGDTFVTLAQGGCVCVPSEYERVNDISGAMVRMNVNNACLIPSVARVLRPEHVPCLKTLILGGEALFKDNLDTWAEKVTLSVVYGPSECTIWCSSQTEMQIDSVPNTIGRSVGALLWVTNATNHDRLCPIGSIGELLIEGPRLARGYLDAEQTKSAFIENPSWANCKLGCHRRFYKTGDLVRYQPDGTLSFIGRKDTQIKLHGRRIELGEIEYHLSCHDLLKQSVVLLPSAGKHRQKLVAIIVFKTGVRSGENSTDLKPLTGIAMQNFTSELANIKAFLTSRIPSYMLPHEWIVVENIPLMVSGKMNRVLSKRFVESLTKAMNEDTSDTSPQNHIHDIKEDRLRQIWSQVLDISIDEVGIENGFVSLGGDSFTAMDLVARCKVEGFDLEAADVLNNSTVRQTATKAKAVPLKVADSAHEDIQLLLNQHKFAIAKPLILRPVWWGTDCPSVVTL